ncbi:hypothetical protein R8Z50_09025 [Longispora sp. K20-0274]|uniref:hypothetical protein n=1 Tax=Longispora sp. K20-0274 TaxID=3088255 RepID=UPI00399C4A6A
MIKKLVRRLVLAGAVCLGMAVTLVATPASATAQCTFVQLPGSGAGCWPGGGTPATANFVNDREISTPTGWWTYQNIDAATVSNLLAANDARPIDLRVLSSSPLRFSVTMVSNSGAYGSSWWWYYGVSMSQVNSFLSTNNARLISAVRYGSVYAVVMVPNYGANYRPWGWCDTDFTGVGTCLGSTNRLTNIEAYASNRFVVIFVNNSAGLGWCWYAGISRAALSNVCGGQSVLDVSQNPDGTFNVASVAQSPADGRVRDFATTTDLVNYAVSSPPDRALFVMPYTSGSTTRWLTSFRHNS